MNIRPIYGSLFVRLFLPLQFDAITLYPFVFFRQSKDAVHYSVLKHEMVHVYQIRAMGWLCFYLSYLLFYLAGLLRYRSHSLAYFCIPYEVEATDLQYKPLTYEEAFELGVD